MEEVQGYCFVPNFRAVWNKNAPESPLLVIHLHLLHTGEDFKIQIEL